MIDPLTALAAISSAVSLVKKAVKTVDDVASLGPVLGKYFAAKEQAIEVVKKSQQGGFKGSALGQALELEMALEQAKDFERQVQMLFFQANKMDVWQRITARAKQMEVDAAHAARRKKEAQAQRKSDIDDWVLILTAATATVLLFGITGYYVLKALQR